MLHAFVTKMDKWFVHIEMYTLRFSKSLSLLPEVLHITHAGLLMELLLHAMLLKEVEAGPIFILGKCFDFLGKIVLVYL